MYICIVSEYFESTLYCVYNSLEEENTILIIEAEVSHVGEPVLVEELSQLSLPGRYGYIYSKLNIHGVPKKFFHVFVAEISIQRAKLV